jgi:hypothetical protein
MTTRLLGHDDEPQNSGAVVAVNYGDYSTQEIWVSSGANIGNWYPLGGEFGRPRVAEDPRNELEKITNRDPWRQPAGTIPLHPHWDDVLARGPVTLLVAGDVEAYTRGWRAGRRALWQSMENELYDDPS